ncbi:thiamin-phosphate pyrophosphorylase, putative [Plasmodium gallinaceum]|uniref:Thiamin-phosphate pyrophosphorylase, putative n=1 Tax=Plasmodium gallinaceum TaxID=5849 RepID=A0A1J1GMQ2_PLAGA|nr:thiamin-phosphate pyrophosphorylase, putative [Plasmodium gallinaceum]CRG93720.1 thiamin-phosphate pyrophosphorylase, putative [Plasmodium gallinaceum]
MMKSYNFIKSIKRSINYSLYLVTDDKFLKDKENVCQHFIDKIVEGVLGGVSLVQLRLKKSDDIYFYNMAVKVKNKLNQHNIPLIINNRLDICLSVDADGVHLGKTDIPLNIARNVLGEKKIIGATINFSDEKDIEMAINNNIDYIAHEHSLYDSETKKTTSSYAVGLIEQINLLQCKIKCLKEKRKISPYSKIPPILLIGGINTMNIKETMINFYDICSGIAIASGIIGEYSNPFLNALKLRFIIDKYKNNYNIAFINMYSNLLNYLFYKITNNEVCIKNILKEKNEQENKNFMNEVVTNANIKKNVLNFFINNCKHKILQLNQSIINNSKIKVYLYESKFLYSNNQSSSIVNNSHYDECVIKWIEKNKNESIKNKIFILIGEEILHLFKKYFQPEFFKLNFFFLIEKNSQISYDSFKHFEYDIENVSIKYAENFINIILKNNFFNDDKVLILGLFLSYFLITQEKIAPQFLSKIITESNSIDDDTLLKCIGAIDISLKLLGNKQIIKI